MWRQAYRGGGFCRPIELQERGIGPGLTNECKCLRPVSIKLISGPCPSDPASIAPLVTHASRASKDVSASNIEGIPSVRWVLEPELGKQQRSPAGSIFCSHPGEASHVSAGTFTKALNPIVTRKVCPQAAGIGTQNPGQSQKRGSLHRSENRARETHRSPQRN